MKIVKIFLILIWLYILPLFVGSLFSVQYEKGQKSNWRRAWLYGYLLFFALFQVLAIPLTFLYQPFSLLVYLYGGGVVLLSVIGFLVRRKEILQWVRELPSQRMGVYGMMALALIAFQTAAVVLGMHVDADDSFFVATANTTVATNTMFQYDAYTGDPYLSFPARYVLAPYQIWIAFISRAVQMHPAAVAHTLLPAALIPLAYVVFSLIGEELLGPDKKKNEKYLLFTAVIIMSSYYSVYTQGTFLLVRIWQGKAVLAAILLPAVFWLCIRLMIKKQERCGWFLLVCAMLASLMTSSMGILLPVLVVAVFALKYGLIEKDFRTLGKSILVCLPNLLFAVFYLLLKG